MPSPELPPLEKASSFLVDAFIAAVLSFAVSISLADRIARKHEYEIDANQASDLLTRYYQFYD